MFVSLISDNTSLTVITLFDQDSNDTPFMKAPVSTTNESTVFIPDNVGIIGHTQCYITGPPLLHHARARAAHSKHSSNVQPLPLDEGLASPRLVTRDKVL